MKSILIIIFGALVWYGIIGFIILNFNILEWSIWARLIYIIVLVSILYSVLNEN